jgi:cytochrome c-type protein NapC
MKAADSAECRNCHRFDKMDLSKQKKRARVKHEEAIEDHITCIDCHKGVAHKPVHAGLDDEEQDDKTARDDTNAERG